MKLEYNLNMIKEIIMRRVTSDGRILDQVRVAPNEAVQFLKDSVAKPPKEPEKPSVITNEMLEKFDLDQ